MRLTRQLAAVLAALLVAMPAAAEPVRLAAAGSLRAAMAEVAAAFEVFAAHLRDPAAAPAPCLKPAAPLGESNPTTLNVFMLPLRPPRVVASSWFMSTVRYLPASNTSPLVEILPAPIRRNSHHRPPGRGGPPDRTPVPEEGHRPDYPPPGQRWISCDSPPIGRGCPKVQF
mgnify:CR=1 FL=1